MNLKEYIEFLEVVDKYIEEVEGLKKKYNKAKVKR